jgi:hypothetical protein
MTRRRTANKELRLPPLACQADFDELIARIKKMTPKESFESAVRAGIFTADGQLTEPYGGPGPRKTKPRQTVTRHKARGQRA